MTGRADLAGACGPTLAKEIRKILHAHLKKIGFIRGIDGSLQPPDSDKESLRQLHAARRKEVLSANSEFLARRWSDLKHHFASGKEICPEAVWPRLELVASQTWQSDLFRLASLTWSVPVSQGFGRRLRFLVWDESKEKLLGLIALGDPVFNLSVRDEWIGWTSADRQNRLTSLLDAYVLGALPPYNFILGGKVVAALIKTLDVQHHFETKFANTTGIISKKQKRAALAAVTTSSSLGRSSVYNRLRWEGETIFRSLGFTKGFGHFHIPDRVFALMREYLASDHHAYAHGFKFGEGPNWKMRAARQALTLAGLNPNLMKHGVRREVFLCEIASNAKSLLRGESSTPNYDHLMSATEMGALARERWMVPRSEIDESYKLWSRQDVEGLLRRTPRIRPFPLPAAWTGTDGSR